MYLKIATLVVPKFYLYIKFFFFLFGCSKLHALVEFESTKVAERAVRYHKSNRSTLHIFNLAFFFFFTQRGILATKTYVFLFIHSVA